MALGSKTYSSVTWTTGDTITELKLDDMVNNDQAYDAHAAEGILLNNNVGYWQKDAGGTSRNVANINASDNLVLGENAKRPTRFVPVENPSALFYDSGVGAAKTSWTDVDVSSIVSSTAYAVAYRLRAKQNNGNVRFVWVQQNGEGGANYDYNSHMFLGSGILGTTEVHGFVGVVELDSNKIFEYQQSSAGGTDNDCQYTFNIIGYYEYFD